MFVCVGPPVCSKQFSSVAVHMYADSTDLLRAYATWSTSRQVEGPSGVIAIDLRDGKLACNTIELFLILLLLLIFLLLSSSSSTTAFRPFSQMKPESLRVSSRTARAPEITDDNEINNAISNLFFLSRDRPEKVNCLLVFGS